MKNYVIGWFGIPGTSKHTKTHIVDGNYDLICGSKVGDKMQFQWCSHGVSDYVHRYVECEKCKKVWRNKNVYLTNS